MQKITNFNLQDYPHRRYNALSGDWILVSPHRAKRPWQGKQEKISEVPKLQYDPKCYLCAGNTRANGKTNPQYPDTFVFTNDFAALTPPIAPLINNNNTILPETEHISQQEQFLFNAQVEVGTCRVICFSPRHDLTLAEMEVGTIEKVVQLWTNEFETLSQKDYIKHIQIFENKGQIMGCSNPHPHGQIWAQSSVPLVVQKEDNQQAAYFSQYKRSLLSDYLAMELQKQERLVCENEHFAVVVPFWACWPYETLVISKRHLQQLPQMTIAEQYALADIIKTITTIYDNIFEVSFPYSAGMHQAPTDGRSYPHWHWHMHFYPPLLRSANIKKFMVGYEMLGDPQRDITAESIAKKLKTLPTTHYKKYKQ